MPFLAGLAAIGGGAGTVAAGALAANALSNKGKDAPEVQRAKNWEAKSADVKQAELQNFLQTPEGQAALQRTTGALDQQQQLVQALQDQQGIQNQSNVFNQQQALANQLQQRASGQAPSIAEQQLANTTGANVANQAALMAGQRGASQNVGLIARQAAQQGGALQQQAAGQGAALRLQEQNQALNQLQQQQNMLGNLATQQVGQQTAATAQQAALAGQQQQALAQNQQAMNQANIANVQQANQANVQNVASQNAANSALQQQILSGDTQQKVQGQKSEASLVGGLIKGIGAAAALAEGGQVGSNAILKENYKGSSSKAAEHLHLAYGSKQGGVVPGKAEVKGDSYANDKVKALLSPGEIVLPRSVAQAKNAPEAAAKFVAALKAKKKAKS